jgi:cytoskeletal protein RodZ
MLTIGQRLKKEREARYLTIEKASEETRIRMVFLKALEADDYSVMPSAAQGRGFLRNYAAYLDINIDEVIADMQRNAPPVEEVSGPLPQVNLLETEVPSLTEAPQESNFLSSLTLRLRSALIWLSNSEEASSTLQKSPLESVIEEAAPAEPMLEAPKPKGRKKKKIVVEDEPAVIAPAPAEERIEETKDQAQEIPVEVEQAEAGTEAKASLLQRLLSLIPSRQKKEEALSSLEVDEELPVEKESESLKPSLPANVIFAEIGKQLRERRELISLTPEEVERHIKLRVVFVKALEEGAFEKLPSTVQTRGMLANYATFLDMDADKILLRYADALQARRREKYSETPREKIQTEVNAAIPLLRGFIAGDLVFGITMITVLLALGAWGIGKVISSQNEANAEPTSASIVNVLVNDSPVTPSPDTFLPVNDPSLATRAAGQPGLLETPTLSLNANVVVSIFSVERAFVRIAVDGEVVFEGRIAPFETQQYEAEEKVEILCGNAAALRITYNGRDLGLMGNVGEVVNRVYTISGIVAPTSTPTPTATNTPLVSNTPTVTITSTPTATQEISSP